MGTINQASPKSQAILTALGDPESRSPKDSLFYKGIHFGDFGTWKTVTSCRLPPRKADPDKYTIGKTFILAQDPGWASYKNHPELSGLVTPQIYLGYRHLEALTEAFYHQIPPYDGYDTFLLDTFSGIQEDYVDTVVRSLTVNKDTRPRFTVKPNEGALAEDVPVRELPGNDDYHAVKNILRPIINKLMAAPVNVIFIAHEREPNDQDKSKTTLKYARPSLTESVFKVAARGVHCIAYFEATDAEKTRVNVSLVPRPKRVAKSRIKSLEGKIVSPEDFPRFIYQWQTKQID